MEDLLYDRQKTISMEIPRSAIAVIGCGGVGFHLAKILAMSGVLKLKLFDFDTLEISNLNRIDLPVSYIGRNKAEAVKSIVNKLRPDCDIEVFPFRFSEKFTKDVEFIVDCTDKVSAQRIHEEIADKIHLPYLKLGYNGTHMTISNRIARWSTEDDDLGYTTTPSWVVPAIVVAALGANAILRYKGQELSCDLENLYVRK